jgi:translation initiation factor IF-2
MSHKHKNGSHHGRISKSREWLKSHKGMSQGSSAKGASSLEIVLKCDSSGSVEAVTNVISGIVLPEVEVTIIHSGVGYINKSDIMIAETGSKLIIGYEIDVLPGIDELIRESGVEVRLYNVIYTLTADIRNIADSLIPHDFQEQIIGSARVIELYKSSRKGIIIGCEVLDGFFATGKRFRIISEMGPVYSGTIESMHIEKSTVQKVSPGQQVGIKIKDFKRVKIGDLVESFHPSPLQKAPVWRPKGEVIQKT